MEKSIEIVKSFLDHFMVLYCNGKPNEAWMMLSCSLEAALAFMDPENRQKAVSQMLQIIGRVGEQHYEDAADYEEHYNNYLKGERE